VAYITTRCVPLDVRSVLVQSKRAVSVIRRPEGKPVIVSANTKHPV